MVTFLEDALRIITQWNDQLLYLRDYRHSKLLPVTLQFYPFAFADRDPSLYAIMEQT